MGWSSPVGKHAAIRALRRLAGAGVPAAVCISLVAAAPMPAAAGAPEPGYSGDPPLYGVTIDRIPRMKPLLSALAALPERPTARVYFDVGEPASYYASPVAEISRVGTVMGELLDSSDEKRIGVAAFQERVESYISQLGSSVGIWEMGNEVNGNWTGSYPDVAAKLTEAYEDVAAAGGRTALTLYANNFGPAHCGDGESELTPVQFTNSYVPSRVAQGLNYVFLSYYPTQCGGIEPSSAQVAEAMLALHALYPNAALGFGEVGLPRHATRRTLAQAGQIMSWAYSLAPGLPYYVGGYFWWYAVQDALSPKSPLAAGLTGAFAAESEALAAGP